MVIRIITIMYIVKLRHFCNMFRAFSQNDNKDNNNNNNNNNNNTFLLMGAQEYINHCPGEL